MSMTILDRMILSNTVASWLTILAVIVFMLLFSLGISKLVAWFSVKYLTKVDHTNFKETIFNRLTRPLSRFLFWLVTIIALHMLNFPEVLNFFVFKTHVSELLHKASVAWLIFLFFNMLIGVMHMVTTVFKRSATKKGDRSMIQLASLLSDLIRAALIVMCILFIIKTVFNITAASFATSIGLVTAALALAAKETVENIICSIIILLDKPFLIGDYITVSGTSGYVERIGLRRTVLRTDLKTLASVPNREVAGTKMENVSDQTFRRFRQELRLDPAASADQLSQLVEAIKEMMRKHGAVITSHTIFLKSTGAPGHAVFMEYFVGIQMAYADFCALNQQINLEIVQKMEALDIKQLSHAVNA